MLGRLSWNIQNHCVGKSKKRYGGNQQFLAMDQQVEGNFHPKGKNLWTSWTKRGALVHILMYLSLGGWNRHTSLKLSRFKKLFLPAVSSMLENGPAILFMDGHASHISLELIRPARAYGVILSCLPSYTTHTHTPAVRCWCIWVTEEQMGQNPEGVQDGDLLHW